MPSALFVVDIAAAVVGADASGVVVGSGAPEGVFARSTGVGGGTEGDFARGSKAGGGVAAGGALRPRRSPMMRCSAGGAGRRSAAGPGESASRRLWAPGGRAGAAPLVGGRLGVPGRGSAGGVEGMPDRMPVEAFVAPPGVPGRRPVEAFAAPPGVPGCSAVEAFAAPPGVPGCRPVEAFEDDIADDAFEGDIADDAFEGLPGVPGRIAFEAFEGDIDDEAFEGDIDDEVFGGIDDESFGDPDDGHGAFDDPAPGRIDGELVSAPGRIVDESFDDPPGRIDVGPLGGVPRRGGDGARDDSFSRVCPAQVSSTGGGGGKAGALSRKTFVDVRSGTPSFRSLPGGVTSTRGDDTSCWANGDVMSIVADVLGSTRVADESN
jgi:hypothetical protein